jgi:hypothetical protein
MALRGQVVDLIRLHFLHHVDEAGGVGHVTIVEDETARLLVRILVKVVDAVGVQQGSAAFDAVHFIPLCEKKFGEISAVLTGNACD